MTTDHHGCHVVGADRTEGAIDRTEMTVRMTETGVIEGLIEDGAEDEGLVGLAGGGAVVQVQEGAEGKGDYLYFYSKM